MRELVWSPNFIRQLKRLVRQNPSIKQTVEQTLERLSNNPFSPSLKTHKLKGKLANKWSCSIDYSNRIIFQFIDNYELKTEEIVLLAIGSHDEVY
ncbi:type II toxin-antitoxin system YafQ family toxin [Crocosphaera watsonii]|uniref:Plasmid stabilization system n=1 Tax=Crocosphaera watsonii WH 8502 TaxID=423474 RepID=T2IG92_CROWT|nr:type II toxin-antitoxin system mRNA interferase toxin, RelE/StbE family [Crocosphaera watsonii]CCQ51250.1 Plasmid stabilization system [Crocosphaera watsonii WH 8502]